MQLQALNEKEFCKYFIFIYLQIKHHACTVKFNSV